VFKEYEPTKSLKKKKTKRKKIENLGFFTNVHNAISMGQAHTP